MRVTHYPDEKEQQKQDDDDSADLSSVHVLNVRPTGLLDGGWNLLSIGWRNDAPLVMNQKNKNEIMSTTITFPMVLFMSAMTASTPTPISSNPSLTTIVCPLSVAMIHHAIRARNNTQYPSKPSTARLTYFSAVIARFACHSACTFA